MSAAKRKTPARKPKNAPTAFIPSDQIEIRPKGGRFQKGQSGNPGGRPKEFNEVRDLARQHTTDAIERLVEWLKSDNAKASVSAATALLDRAWGKPAQNMEVSGRDGAPLMPVLHVTYG